MSAQTPIFPEEVTSDDRLWGLLAYLLTPLVPIIILLLEDKKNRPFLKAHTMQALILGVVLIVFNILMGFIPVVGWCIGPIVTIILVIFYGIKANRGEVFEIPVITNFVKNQGWA